MAQRKSEENFDETCGCVTVGGWRPGARRGGARRVTRLAAAGARGYGAELWSRARNVLPVGGFEPTVAVDAWVAPNATVVGRVLVSNRASVWFGAVVRGDLASATGGAYSSVGDRAVVATAR